MKRNRFVQLAGGTKSVNRDLEAKAKTLAGWKGYANNLVDAEPEFVTNAYHQPWHVEKSFRMSKHDLKARPIYHHKRESIEAHLTIVFAALAITRLVESPTGWSIKKFVREALPDRADPCRQAHRRRRKPDPRRPTRRARPDQLTMCALA